MKFSYTTLLDYPLADSLEHIKKADELGYYACYAADETWHKDLWLLYAAAADKTKNVRFGPNLSSVYLREPTLICQALATLDELTGGRAEGVISCGNFGMLTQYGVDWKTIKPFSRVKEAHEVMRTFLDDGVITYEGQFHTYNGLFTFARPVQEHLPLYIGAMRGPKSMQLAGEVSDGVHSALGYNKAWYDYVVENVKIGAESAGRDWTTLDIGAWCVVTCGPDSEKAKTAARAIVTFYLSSQPDEQFEAHGIDPDEVKAIVEVLGKRRARQGVRDDDARDRRQALDRRHARGVRRADQGDRVGRRQPHDPLHHRPLHPEAVRSEGRRRPGRPGPAPAHRRRGDARVQHRGGGGLGGAMAVTSEQTLTQQQRATFWALADVLIPATDAMPAASEAGSADKWLDRALAARPDLVPALTRGAGRRRRTRSGGRGAPAARRGP